MRGEGGKTLEPKLTHIGRSIRSLGGNTPSTKYAETRAERSRDYRPTRLAL